TFRGRAEASWRLRGRGLGLGSVTKLVSVPGVGFGLARCHARVRVEVVPARTKRYARTERPTQLAGRPRLEGSSGRGSLWSRPVMGPAHQGSDSSTECLPNHCFSAARQGWSPSFSSRT